MSAIEVGDRLVALCREGKNLEAIDTLYADTVVSVEAGDMPGLPRVIEGVEAVRGKTVWWLENHQVHGGDVEGPFPHDDRFAVYFDMDITPKQTGQRMAIKEIGLYTVEDGKVTREEFFYRGA